MATSACSSKADDATHESIEGLDANPPDGADTAPIDLDVAPDLGTPSCGSVSAFASCDTCLAGACCDAERACADDPDCTKCVRDEDHEACHASADVQARANAVFVCQADHCSDACFPDGGAPTDEGSSCKGLISGACGTCLEASCCTQLALCFDNAHCKSCVTTGAEEECHADAEGHVRAHSLWDCSAKSCEADCK